MDIYAADGTVTCYVISHYSDAGIDIFEGEIPSDDKCERTETTISENECNSIVDAVKSSNFILILIISHNKTLAGQLYGEMKEFFPENVVEYFVSYSSEHHTTLYLVA